MQIDNALGIPYWVSCAAVGTVRLTAHLSDSVQPQNQCSCVVSVTLDAALTARRRYPAEFVRWRGPPRCDIFGADGQLLQIWRVSHRTGEFDGATHGGASTFPRVCL